jgi:hypothetical protein
MIGFMYYNRFGHAGFTDRHKARTSGSVQTCPVCLLQFDARGGTLPDGRVLDAATWTTTVCKTVKDDTVNGGYQAGCLAGAYPAS